jgi:prophage regulatory protein
MDRTNQFLRMPQLKQKVALSRSQIYRLIQQGEFPKPIKLGDKIAVWVDSEINEWMTTKVHTRH